MAESYKKYDLIIQNSGSKKEWLYQGLIDTSTSDICYNFENVSIPDEAPNGEYYYALIWNIRTDVSYTIKNDILDTIVTTDEGTFTLRDLGPETGILRIGEVDEKNVYRTKNKDFLYRTK